MAHIVRKRKGMLISTTVHLTNDDVVKICDAAAPTTAFASLLLTAADGGLSGAVLQAIATAATWRLKSKNAEFGHRGVRIKFRSGGVFPMMIAFDAAVAAATLRIKPPKD